MMEHEPFSMETIRGKVENNLPMIFDSFDNVGFYQCMFNFPKIKEPPAWVQITQSYFIIGRAHTRLGELKCKSRFIIHSLHESSFYTDTFFIAIQKEDIRFRGLFREYGLINYPADVFPALTMEMMMNAIEDTYGKGQFPW